MKPIYQLFSVCVFAIFLSGLMLGSPAPWSETALAQMSDPVFVGAGDIAHCNRTQDESTAQLLDNIAGTVFTLGDNAYPDGTTADFNNCYGPTWGRHKARTRPAPAMICACASRARPPDVTRLRCHRCRRGIGGFRSRIRKRAGALPGTGRARCSRSRSAGRMRLRRPVDGVSEEGSE